MEEKFALFEKGPIDGYKINVIMYEAYGWVGMPNGAPFSCWVNDPLTPLDCPQMVPVHF